MTSQTVTMTAHDGRELTLADEHLRKVLQGEAYLLFDGAMGTMLESSVSRPGDLPDLLNLTKPEAVTAVHRQYVEAGSQVVTTNTFGANPFKLRDAASVEDVYVAAITCARASGARYVAADIGPTGKLMRPMGVLTFEDAKDIFSQQARAAKEGGADLVIVETMADLQEAKAAVEAVCENTDLPVFATMTFDKRGRTYMGVRAEDAARELCAAGASAVGANCSVGPDAMLPIAEVMRDTVSCPVIIQANAGLPQLVDDKTIYPTTPEEYVDLLQPIMDAGVTIFGGCCGTNPRYITLMHEALAARAALGLQE